MKAPNTCPPPHGHANAVILNVSLSAHTVEHSIPIFVGTRSSCYFLIEKLCLKRNVHVIDMKDRTPHGNSRIFAKKEHHMFRKYTIAAIALLALGGNVTHAKPCRDKTGKFTQCEAPKKAKPCRDEAGKFIKCAREADKKASTATAPQAAPAPQASH